MRRREFLGVLGGAAATWPLPVRAQPTERPVIGFLHSGSPTPATELVKGFRSGLGDAGYDEGRNVQFEFRWAEGHYERLTPMASDLVARRVSLIATGGGLVSAVAAKQVTADIPIVFAGGSDPVAAGLVASINRPSGNVTGALNSAAGLTAKRLGLLRGLIPIGTTIGVLVHPENSEAVAAISDVQQAASRVGYKIQFANAKQEAEFEPALVDLVRANSRAIFIINDPYFAARRQHLTAVIARHSLPAIYPQRQYSVDGGLISYGSNFVDVYRQAGVYAGRILRGQSPADLPIVQPTRFELVINLRTAKTLGLDLPPMLLALADEVIE